MATFSNKIPVANESQVTLSFDTAAAAAAGDSGTSMFIMVDGLVYEYDPTGTDLTTADTRTWRLKNKGLISSQSFHEYGDEMIGLYGGIGIQDTIDTTKKRSVFRIDRTVTDLATADFTDPGSGAFTQPQLVEVSYTVNGEYGTDGSGARGSKLFSGKLVNNSNQPANMANYTLFNGGISPKASWGGGVIEMYDTSSALGLSTIGDPDQDPLADTAGVTGNTMIGLEINGKMKANTTFVGLQILPRTYGRVVTDEGRPKADRCIFLGPSRNGSDFVGGSYLDDATGADILRMIDMSSGPADGSNAARTDYGIWSRMAFEEAAIALPLTDNIVFDNDAGTPNQLKLFGSAAGVLAISANGGTNSVAEFRAARATFRNSIYLETQSTTPQNRVIDFRTNGALRHRLSVDNTSESGSNQGSYAHWYSYADDGTTATEIFSISRQSHIIDFKNQVRMSGLPTSSAGLSAGDLWNDSGTLKVA